MLAIYNVGNNLRKKNAIKINFLHRLSYFEDYGVADNDRKIEGPLCRSP
jgi:hypothetical protein